MQADVTGRENKKPSTPTPELQIHAGNGGNEALWTCSEGPLGTGSSILLQHSEALRPLRLFGPALLQGIWVLLHRVLL